MKQKTNKELKLGDLNWKDIAEFIPAMACLILMVGTVFVLAHQTNIIYIGLLTIMVLVLYIGYSLIYNTAEILILLRQDKK